MTSYVFLAEGFEEVEALTPVDVMRRAGLEVKTVSITDSHRVTGAHGVTVEADMLFHQVDFGDADRLIAPGGMPGSSNLHAFEPLNHLLRNHYANGRHIAAICAAPAVVLAPLGILSGKKATCYPGFEKVLTENGAIVEARRYVVDGNVITGNGPSSALLFALAIVADIQGKEAANTVASGMLLYPSEAPYYF